MSMSARGGKGGSYDPLKLVERTKDAFVSSEDTENEDARQTLLQVRKQYDQVHHEAEQKEARLRQLREAIRLADSMHSSNSEEAHDFNEEKNSLELQLKDTVARLEDTQLSRKVYEHMLARMQKEQAILKQKMLKMEEHLGRKSQEVVQKKNEVERAKKDRVVKENQLFDFEVNKEEELKAFAEAREVMGGELKRREASNQRRARFDQWRKEVALTAANQAFNDSAGRLRKLCAIEKLASNQLQKTTIEQVEHSQKTEDGFQKIREVTGLTDVMDIVHKFLNRDHEHEQLKSSVKDAEVHLEALRQEFEAVKGQTEGITFHQAGGVEGEIFKAREETERELEKAMEEHQAARGRLQRTTLQVEHMKRWTVRVGQLLSGIEEPADVRGHGDLKGFFDKLQATIDKFTRKVGQQITDGKLTRKVLMNEFSKEYARQNEMLADPNFISINRRVPPPDKDDPRSSSRQELTGEDDPDTLFREDRNMALKKEHEFIKSHQEAQKAKAKEDKERKQQKRP